MKILETYIFIILIAVIMTVIYISFNHLQYLDLKKFTSNFTGNEICGLDFKYIIKNNCEKDRAIKVIQIVTSFAGHTKLRSDLRRTYPKAELEKLGIFRVFLLAMLKPGVSEVTQEAISHENMLYSDIIQGNFDDDYRNLTYKHIMGLRWAVTECNPDYIIKMDDDIIADLPALMETIRSRRNTPYDILGEVFWEAEPRRSTDYKHYVTKDEYPYDTYPTYVSGWLYVIKSSAAEKILSALNSVSFFWIDDIFVTGILAEKVNLTFKYSTEINGRPIWNEVTNN